MLHIENDQIAILCSPNGSGLTLLDKKRWTRWALDERTLICGKEARSAWDQSHFTGSSQMMPDKASIEGNRLTVTYRSSQGPIQYGFTLGEQWVDVTLPAQLPEEIGFVALPGSFTPEREKLQLLLPIMQGMLWDGKGPEGSYLRGEAGHLGFSMPFVGYLGQSGGLLVTAETANDLQWWYGKDSSGRFWATALQIPSLGAFRYDRAARIYLTDPDLVAIAKQYRQKVVSQGRFKSWDEKVAERPYLERLFGTLMCFIGYCEDDIDYVAEAKKLKAYGFDRALLYPARFNIYYKDIHMGGRPAIDLPRETVEAIKALGYDFAPWTWLNEALNDGTEYIQHMMRKGADGKVIPHWAIDEQQWYWMCYSFLTENQRGPLENEIADMTWDHFDVLSCVPALECYALDHANHLGRAMSRSESKEWVRKVFLLNQQYGRMVSSESFNDAFSLEYDLGSVKAWPQYGPWPFWPVPLTMLVYHDSMIHSWWELHSYNNGWRGRTSGIKMFEYGGGRPQMMAAMDALMGCPPDVFPFGAQYGYSGKAKETFLYKYRFEDPEVQIALRAALPVAQLHRRIGKQEMVHFKILSEDGYIQESAFADGTRIVANFSQDFAGSEPGIDHKVVQGVECLAPQSWKIAE